MSVSNINMPQLIKVLICYESFSSIAFNILERKSICKCMINYYYQDWNRKSIISINMKIILAFQ